MKSRIPLLWKWSLRDLREHWMQVLGISIVIALGVALYSSLGSTVPWRLISFEKSYEVLNTFDVRLELTPGSYLDAGRLEQTVRSIPHGDWIRQVDLRLRVPTSIDASTSGQTVLVSGEIIGVDLSQGGPQVDKLHITSGRGLQAGDGGQPVCVVEHNFADYYGLEPGDRAIRISGGETLQPVGVGMASQFFMVVQEGSGALGAYAQDRFAALFVPLETAREITGLPNQANEVLITTVDGVSEANLDQLKVELQDRMEQAFPEVGASLEKRTENLVYTVLYNDIGGDQEMFETISTLLLLGAAFGAFILIGRIVEAQRREIGINMALGVSRLRIARRYLLMGVQIAFLGVVFGVLLGLLMNELLGAQFAKLLPLPYFETPFQTDIFAQGALIGVLVPFAAILYPIWRAVRVPPIEAIRASYLISSSSRGATSGLARLMARIPLPGSSFSRMPLRNLSRGLRRTLMTVLGLAMAVVILVAIIGMIDTFQETVAIGSQELQQGTPDRTMVTLDGFYPVTGTLVAQIRSKAQISQAVPTIMVPGELSGDGSFQVGIQLLDMGNTLWTPTLIRGGTPSQEPGVFINEKAARDLDVDIGDHVLLRHPYREGQHALRIAQTKVRVAGIHRDILRTTVYMDTRDAGVMNLQGMVNGLFVNPSPGTTVDELRRELLQIQPVTSARRVSETLDGIKDLIDQFIGIFQVLQFIVLIMAFFIAFNTTRSNLDERRRDIATMFAFGTRVRTVLRMAVTENLITGILGTAAGVGLGWWFMNTTMLRLFENEAPELNAVLAISLSTFGWAVLIGIVVVALTPIFMVRRLTKMDIPSTLRVIE
jgi:putative ABC transport system permease protein